MHTIFKKSPLKETLFQLKFPTMLLIDSEKPVTFQRKVYSLFPYYEENNSNIKELIIGPQLGEPQINNSSVKNYIFLSEDRKTRIILNNTSLTITTREYNSWKNFSKICFHISDVFIETYKPIFFNRIGLRYINVIERSVYNVANEEWNRLIKPEYLGPYLVKGDSSTRIFNIISESLDERKGIISKEQYSLVKTNTGVGEVCYLADADYISLNKIDVNNVKDFFELLHSKSINYIERIVTNRLLNLMEPENE